MDYSSYFSAPPPHQYYMGLPPTPSYDSTADKLNLQSHLDPASFLQYDAFSFSSLPSGSPPAHHHHHHHHQSHSTVPPALHAVGSVDSGISLDLDTQQASHAHHHNQASPIHANLSTSGLPRPAAAGPSTYNTTSSDAATSASPPPQQVPASPTTRTRSSSEEKDGNNLSGANLTPAQSRRKAQNRAAQRAFRERKERHVRELEDKLRSLENSTHSLQSDNERLKLLLQRAKTENEILRATRGSRPGSPGSGASSADAGGMEMDLDRDAYTTVSAAGGAGAAASSSSGGSRGSGSGSPSAGSSGQRASRSGGGHSRTQHLLGASQTWDLIQSHPLVRSGAVDVADVCERLRTAARCDGQGPVFEEGVIYKVIEEESSRGGGDALI